MRVELYEKILVGDEKKMDINKKTKWTLLLFIALVFFLIGLITQNNIYFLVTIILAFFIKKYGYYVLFKEYDDKNKVKLREIEKSMRK